MAAPGFIDNAAARRYELPFDGHVAVIAYRDTPAGARIFLHTEVPAAMNGRGFGSALVKAALDDVRARGLTVIPSCPFVRAYIDRHPEYAELLAKP